EREDASWRFEKGNHERKDFKLRRLAVFSRSYLNLSERSVKTSNPGNGAAKLPVAVLQLRLDGGAFAGNQAGAAVAREVIPRPLREHQQPVFEFDDKPQVNEKPRQPGGQSVKMKSFNGRHRRRAAD